jgi:hypothetical protein
MPKAFMPCIMLYSPYNHQSNVFKTEDWTQFHEIYMKYMTQFSTDALGSLADTPCSFVINHVNTFLVIE